MANKNLFKSTRTSPTIVKAGPTNTVNEAGGVAYSLDSENALAQLTVTGTFNNTYYVSGEAQVEKIQKLAEGCSADFLAKCAIYGHKIAHMKDTPAFLLAVLAGRGETALVEKVFPQIITNQKMLRNFVQIIRSGKAGRKSFGTALKRTIQNWFTKQRADNLFKGAVGNAPSLADVVKMVHPKPENPEKQAFYAWLLDKKYDSESLPAQVALFECFKKGETTDIPDADFRMLTPFLNKETWTKVALNMPWNALRMNLNTFQRHGVFDNVEVLNTIAAKLEDRESIKRNNAFPYQILTTFLAVKGQVPLTLSLSLEKAMEIATENVPDFQGKRVVVCVDTSGSMNSPITGGRGTATTETTYIQAASLMASCVLRKNPEALILPFDTHVHPAHFNAYDSVLTNAAKLARFGGGGTDCASALRHLNQINYKSDVVIFVSDNESWYNGATARRMWGNTGATSMVEEWATFKKHNSIAKLVSIDIAPVSSTQVPNLPREVLNIGGYNDSIWEIVANFINRDINNFAQVIKDSVSY